MLPVEEEKRHRHPFFGYAYNKASVKTRPVKNTDTVNVSQMSDDFILLIGDKGFWLTLKHLIVPGYLDLV
jgi:hypothetical protein